jgi:hypothetical protein
MEALKSETPGAGTPGAVAQIQISHSEDNKSPVAAQAIRLAWLRRRFDVSPDLAILVATLALGEVRA